MKKKVIIVISIVVFLVLAAAVALICIKKSAWASEKSDEVYMSEESGFEFYPENEYNYAAGEYLDWSGKDYIDFVIDASVEKGELVFQIYDMNGADYNQKDKYTLCEEHIIDKTGVYTFVPENVQEGKSYLFSLDAADAKLDKKDKYVVAKGIFRCNTYKTNWEKLKNKIGIYEE